MVHLRLILLLGWAALIFIGSSFPNPPGATGGEWRYDLAHMVEYTVLGALAFLVVRSFRPAWPAMVVMVAAWTFAVLYGMSDEFHQSFVPNRDASWLDVGFDALGAALGVGLMRVSRRLAPAPPP